jgi:hypothetical protein
MPAAVAATPQPVSAVVETPKEAEKTQPGARAARSPLFGDGSVEELRKAIILKEVLGPPLSLREEAD